MLAPRNLSANDPSCSVVKENRLTNGVLFSMPITLDLSAQTIEEVGIKPGMRVALRDLRDDRNLAILTVDTSISRTSKLGPSSSSGRALHRLGKERTAPV